MVEEIENLPDQNAIEWTEIVSATGIGIIGIQNKKKGKLDAVKTEIKIEVKRTRGKLTETGVKNANVNGQKDQVGVIVAKRGQKVDQNLQVQARVINIKKVKKTRKKKVKS